MAWAAGGPRVSALPVRFAREPCSTREPSGRRRGAFLRGDTDAVRQIFDDLKAARSSALAQDLTFDALYPEAWLLRSLGDAAGAIAWLDPTLATLSASTPEKFADLANAGALVQAMALRAELADQVGDARTAARWARVVTILWSDADPFLQPVVRRMEQLSRGVL